MGDGAEAREPTRQLRGFIRSSRDRGLPSLLDGRNGLFVVRRGRVQQLVATGDSTPLGGTLSYLETFRLTGDGRAFTFVGDLDGGSVARAIFSVDTRSDR